LNNFKHSIDSQFRSHTGANLFNDAALGALCFNEDTLAAIRNIGSLEREQVALLLDYVTDKAIREFCRANQYYSFTAKDREKLKGIYTDLLSALREDPVSLKLVSEQHYRNLLVWLKGANPFAEQIYANDDVTVTPVPCSEYSAELQISILHIDPAALREPLLDIGCGEQGNFVHYMRSHGVEAYGIDRFASGDEFLAGCDWLEFTFEKESWGTIVSNLGFTNHFVHQHFRQDGNFIAYAGKYMEIITSLKINGSFHYAPAVPFIEDFLDKSMYSVEHFPTEAGISATKLTKRR